MRTRRTDERALAQRIRDDRGFTLIELLVVILIIGILAATALPNFVAQRDRAKDATAKQDARNAVSHVESCYVNSEDYRKCTDVSGLGSNTGMKLGSAKGQVEISSSADDAYTITAHAQTGSDYTIQRLSNGSALVRKCVIAAGQNGAGCTNGSW